tara:strand:- start:218 stop:442 length:225 start_codon:yes stop_codon:yes gene_type:complete
VVVVSEDLKTLQVQVEQVEQAVVVLVHNLLVQHLIQVQPIQVVVVELKMEVIALELAEMAVQVLLSLKNQQLVL